MKGKTPVTALIERVLRWFVRQRRFAPADARDRRSLNRHAKHLSAEAADVREYQTHWFEG